MNEEQVACPNNELQRSTELFYENTQRVLSEYIAISQRQIQDPRRYNMELFVTLVDDFQMLTNAIEKSILDVVEILDKPLSTVM